MVYKTNRQTKISPSFERNLNGHILFVLKNNKIIPEMATEEYPAGQCATWMLMIKMATFIPNRILNGESDFI